MKTILKLIPALLFTLYTIYHIVLLVKITEGGYSTNITGRIIGIFIVFMIAVASWFALFPLRKIRVTRSILLYIALSLSFVLKFFNANGIFSKLDFASIPSVLNCAVFIVSQTALLLLLIYYMVIRHNKKLNSNRKLVVALLSVVTALYALCLVMECVLLLKYRFNIELNLKYTLASRLLYYFGFIGMVLSFMRPLARESSPDQDFYEEQNKDNIIVTSPERNTPHSDMNKMRSPVMDNADIIFTSPEINKPHSNMDKKRSPVMDNADIIVSSPEKNKPHSNIDKKRSPVMDDADIVFSTTNNIRSHPKKNK